MSKFNNNNNSSSRSVFDLNKKFCKVCLDAGKPETEYTSHNVRDAKSGRVLCQFLLAQECRNCFQRGHTTKYCKVSVSAKPIKTLAPVKKVKPNAPKNIYAMFDDDSSDEENCLPITEPTPVTQTQLKTNASNVLSYKSIVEKHKNEVDLPIQMKAQIRLQITEAPTATWVSRKVDWTNMGSDSEGEEEEEE